MNHVQKMAGFRVTCVQSDSAGGNSNGYEARCCVLAWVAVQAWDRARRFCRRYSLRGRGVVDRPVLLGRSADSEQEGEVSAALN
jgi:hypothetical protein